MVQDDQPALLQEELAAVKRQMRQLLEVVALVQNQQNNGKQGESFAGTQMRSPGESPAPTLTRVVDPPSPLHADKPLQGEPAAPSVLQALLEENRRLGELVRAQAEEIGMLRERLTQSEVAQSPNGGTAEALSSLLRALRASS